MCGCKPLLLKQRRKYPKDCFTPCFLQWMSPEQPSPPQPYNHTLCVPLSSLAPFSPKHFHPTSSLHILGLFWLFPSPLGLIKPSCSWGSCLLSHPHSQSLSHLVNSKPVSQAFSFQTTRHTSLSLTPPPGPSPPFAEDNSTCVTPLISSLNSTNIPSIPGGASSQLLASHLFFCPYPTSAPHSQPKSIHKPPVTS